ncbi:30S ribosomal protein S13-like protein [Phanerochaete sordida]|uniref:Small ribosomal subunit protein uS13m n=1 Tax=Phanerochaete sordida TaxID=48140 RepID=A0A9P3G9J6_9APHY|nr:30S ribosomal protein S13-like protein [Phanerochaete sordida]
MHVLGILLPDSHLARHALQNFFGIGPKIAHRVCARMQIHDRCKVRDLTQQQQTALTAFLSSPTTYPVPQRVPLASLDFKGPTPSKPLLPSPPARPVSQVGSKDPLSTLKIETELRKEIRDNIQHQRMIGSYVGRRHAAHLPVRGQRTRTNAKIAKRLNSVERRL